MKGLNERTRRGLMEAIGIPGIFGALTLALLLVHRVWFMSA